MQSTAGLYLNARNGNGMTLVFHNVHHTRWQKTKKIQCGLGGSWRDVQVVEMERWIQNRLQCPLFIRQYCASSLLIFRVRVWIFACGKYLWFYFWFLDTGNIALFTSHHTFWWFSRTAQTKYLWIKNYFLCATSRAHCQSELWDESVALTEMFTSVIASTSALNIGSETWSLVLGSWMWFLCIIAVQKSLYAKTYNVAHTITGLTFRSLVRHLKPMRFKIPMHNFHLSFNSRFREIKTNIQFLGP